MGKKLSLNGQDWITILRCLMRNRNELDHRISGRAKSGKPTDILRRTLKRLNKVLTKLNVK